MTTASIISTYPEKGSQNIGDKLIEVATKQLLQDVLGISKFETISRTEIASNLHTINTTQVMVFACLALRRNMFPTTYNMPHEPWPITVPAFAVASGTCLSPSEIELQELGLCSEFDTQTTTAIHSLSHRLKGISCRGEISYNVLRGLAHQDSMIEMTGDVAFWDSRFKNRTFSEKHSVRSIAVSTPHHAKMYAEHFLAMAQCLRKSFPAADIHLMLHGKSPWLQRATLESLDFKIHELYTENVEALDLYDDMDVHIGYRVHAHVSALSRRIPSYLFAIDGRGWDYCKTLATGTAVKAWRLSDVDFRQSLRTIKSVLLQRNQVYPVVADKHAIEYLVDLMQRDAALGFVRFLGFDREIVRTTNRLENFVRKIGEAVL